jgi:RHS repeat-associated protein
MRKGVTNNWTLYFQQDANGNVTELTWSDGGVVEIFQYDAFGALNKAASGWGNPFLFTGRRYQSTFGIYEWSEMGIRDIDGKVREGSGRSERERMSQYRARAYSPRLGRFTSEDPKLFDAGDYNLFRYCHNDPLDLTDPMGLEEQYHQPRTWEQLQKLLAARELAGLSTTRARAAMSAAEGVMQRIKDTIDYALRGNTSARPAAVERTQLPGDHSSFENGKYIAHIPLRLTLLDEHGRATLGSGIHVDETIDEPPKNPVNYAGKGTYTHDGWTDRTGSVKDGWKVPFNAPTGQVTKTQHVIVNGHEAVWTGTVNMNHPNPPTLTGQYWAPFKY